MWWRSRKVAAFARLCVFGGLCVDMWRLVHQWSFFAVWLSFDCFWRFVHCTNRQKHSKPLVYKSSQVYQDCTISVPAVYQSSKTVTNSQNTVKSSTKMTTGVPVVTCLPRLYQQCNNSLPIINKNLAIANRSRVSYAHNTSRAVIALFITPWPWNID